MSLARRLGQNVTLGGSSGRGPVTTDSLIGRRASVFQHRIAERAQRFRRCGCSTSPCERFLRPLRTASCLLGSGASLCGNKLSRWPPRQGPRLGPLQTQTKAQTRNGRERGGGSSPHTVRLFGEASGPAFGTPVAHLR